MSLNAMVAASRDGKLADFEAKFKQEVGTRVAQRIDDMKVDLGQSIKVDGEYTKEG
jgi:hypothetical protein